MSKVASAAVSETGTVEYRRSRRVLTVMWFGSAAACFAAALYLWLGNWIGFEGFRMLCAELSQIYLVYVMTIVAFTFSPRRPGGSAPVRLSALLVACALSAGFNLLLLGAVVTIAFDVQNVEEAVPFIELVAVSVSPVIAPALAYFFARPESSE
jgi:hypothetical protein